MLFVRYFKLVCDLDLSVTMLLIGVSAVLYFKKLLCNEGWFYMLILEC